MTACANSACVAGQKMVDGRAFPDLPSGADQTPHRLCRIAVRKHSRQRSSIKPEMLRQQSLGDRAQISGRPQVAIFQQLASTQARPLAADAPASDRTAEYEGDGAGTVVGALGTVRAN